MNIALYLFCIVICAQMWRMGGDGQSLWRNPGVPIVIALFQFFMLNYNWWVLLYIPALWGMLQAFSYGVSAPLHIMWVWIIGKINGKYDDPAWKGMADNGQIPGIEGATRASCGFFWSIPAVIFAFFTANWWLFGAYSLFLTISNGLIGALVADVEISERAVGACVSTSIFV